MIFSPADLTRVLTGHGPVALLLAQILVILLVSRLVGVGFRKIGQPLVVAEIVAGILLGPSGFGAVAPEWMNGLFPTASLGILTGVSQLGLTLFMFVVGLEFDPSLLQGKARLAASLGPASILIPFAMGIGLAFYLYPILSSPDVPFLGFALFCGASMAVTAFPVLARILAEVGLTKTSIGALTLTCAAINDVVAWCLLAFVIAVVRAGGIAGAWLTTLATLLFIAGMFFVIRPLLARLVQRYGSSRHFSQGSLAGVLGLWLLSSLASELIGVHALFGAFVFGAIIPREGHMVRNLVERMEDLVGVLLLPIFFASTGLKTQIGLLDSPELWGIGAIVVGVASLGKIVGSAGPALLGGLSLRESGAIAIMMNTRGLMELIILNIGLELGVLSPTLFAMLVLMAVITTFVTSPVLALLFPAHEIVALQAEQQTTPVATPAVLSVVTCISHPDSLSSLIKLTAQLCQGTDAYAYTLRLSPVEEDASLFPEEDTAEEDMAAGAARAANDLGVRAQPISFPSANPARDISEVVRIKKADLVLMGAHRSILGGGPLGGVVREVANRTTADLAMLLDMGSQAGGIRFSRLLFARGGPHEQAAARVVALLGQRGVTVDTLDQVGRGVAVEVLLKKAQQYDIIVTGFEGVWLTALLSSHLDKGKKLQELPCSLLAVHGHD